MLYFLLPILFSVFIILKRDKKFNIFILILNAFVNLIFSISLISFFEFNTKYFVVDPLNKPFIFALSIVFSSVSLYSVYFLNSREIDIKWNSFYVISLIFFDILLMLTLLVNHLGLYWVLLEATTILTAPLIYFNKSKHSLEATWKYIFICSIGIAIGFIGIVFISLTFKDLNSLFFKDFYTYQSSVSQLLLKISFLFILIGFGTKSGLAPVHFWLPDAHSEAPAPISALLSAALLNSALIGIIRILKIMYIFEVFKFTNLMLVLMGFLSIFVATVFILRIKNIKRILAYSSIENIGIITLGLGLGGYGFFSSFVHIISHSILKSSLFLTSGNIIDFYKTKNYDEINFLYKKAGYTSFIFILSIIGILAVPPSLSFISEFYIVKEMIIQKRWILLISFLILLTVIFFSFIKILVEINFSDKKDQNIEKEDFFSVFPQIALIFIVFLTGVLFVPFFKDMLIESVEWLGSKWNTVLK